ncbi:MAG: outer membrane lipid asymmetry maintenance protein MlaD [Alphaproteobacteria bacterium]
MNRNPVETVLGILVIAVAAFFLTFAYKKADLKTVDGYKVKATFAKAGGLDVGTDVRISGIKVGSVTKRELDKDTYLANIEMTINNNVALPIDTIANISGDGVLGGNYVRLEPGKSKDMLKPDEKISKTNDYKSLEDTVGEIIFLVTKK